MSNSYLETLVNLRSFIGSALGDLENKYTQVIHDNGLLQEKITRLCDSTKQLQDENERLSAKVKELDGKLHHNEVKLSRKDEELQQKNKWWEAYKHMSQKRFRVMKMRGKFPPEVLEKYVNKSIQELISTTCGDLTTTEDSVRRTNPNKLCRNKHKMRTRYEDITSSNSDQIKDKVNDEQGRSDSDDNTGLCTVVVTQPALPPPISEAGVLVPDTLDIDSCPIGPPAAASTPVCVTASDTQSRLTDWAPVTRLPASDSQFPVDLSQSQPHSPTIPSYAQSTCYDKSGGISNDSSYSMLPPRQNDTEHRTDKKNQCTLLTDEISTTDKRNQCTLLTDEISTTDKTNQTQRENCGQKRSRKLTSQEKQCDGGKRKREDSVEKAQKSEHRVCAESAVFKRPKPVMLGDLPKHTKESKVIYVISDDNTMDTSALDMFADHSLAGSANEHSPHTVQSDRPLVEERESACKTPIKECPSMNKKKQEATNYKYIEVVRKKDEREKLNGYSCRDCQKYFGSLGLSEEELKERLKQCSRHRAKFSPPPSTPPDFWNLSFPDTQTYMDKGYLQTDAPHARRKARKKNACHNAAAIRPEN